MDSDEALARRLQIEEMEAEHARVHAERQEEGTAVFRGNVQAHYNMVHTYEDEMSQAVAISVMPLQLQTAALEACAVSDAMGEQPALAWDDAFAQELLLWFKKDFFTWVNSPPCDSCGSSNTRSSSAVEANAEEAIHKARRTELHRCNECGATIRFPRYDDAVKLLETRRGRCGEWANCFTLCCRAAGLEARLVVDFEDHVWTEYWSPAGGRWVHLDPCEAAYDKPLLYEAGWGKKLSYVIAVGRHGIADVTRRYTRQYEQLLERRVLVQEAWLVEFLRSSSAALRALLPPEQRSLWEEREETERHQLLTGSIQPPSAENAALPARQTGDAAWLAARGEDGSRVPGAGTADAAAMVPPPGTRYRLANDEGLQAVHPLRLCGGAVRASGEHAPGELAAGAFDGQTATKWLDFAGKQGNAWLEYRLPAEHAAAVLAEYALTSANDSPERDPQHVVLEAWIEATEAWVQLDEQRHLAFPRRHHRLLLPLGGEVPPSRRFRLRVVSVADPAAANSVQLACLELLQREEQPQQQQEHDEKPLQEQQQQQQQERKGKQQLQQQQAAAETVAHQLTGLGLHQQQRQPPQEQPQPPPQPLPSPQPQPPQQPQPPPQPQPPLPPASQPAAPLPAVPAPAGASAGAPEQPENPWAALFLGGASG